MGLQIIAVILARNDGAFAGACGLHRCFAAVFTRCLYWGPLAATVMTDHVPGYDRAR